MKDGKIGINDGEKLMMIYEKFDIHGNIKGFPLTSDELVLLFCIAKGIGKGDIVNKDNKIV